MKKGLTLVELTVAMGIFVVVLTITLAIIVDIFKLQSKNIIMKDVQQNARAAIELISKEARAADNLIVSPSSISIKYIDPTTATETIVIYRLTSDKKITRKENSEPEYSITSDKINIRTLSFVKSNKILNVTITASDKDAKNPANQDEITIQESVYIEGLSS